MEIPFLNKLSLGDGFALFKKGSQVLGVDLGSSNLKIIQLKKERSRILLETYGEIATGPYADLPVGKSAHLLDAKVREMMMDLMKEAGAKAEQAIVSLPLRSSFIKVISFPIISEEELKEAIPFEARKHIPVPTNEVVLNWMVLPQGEFSKSGDEGFIKERKTQDILLIAIHRDAIEKYQNIFQSTRLGVKAFEIEIFSYARSVLSKELHPSLLVDLGAQSTRFVIVDYGVIRMAHTIDRGSLELTDALSRSLGIEFDRAEHLKYDTGLSSRPEHKEIKSVIEPILDNIFSEGSRVISEYYKKYGRSVKKAYLLGGGALLNGIQDFAVSRFGIEVRFADPFSKVEYPAFLKETLREIGPTFATAMGAALRAIDRSEEHTSELQSQPNLLCRP